MVRGSRNPQGGFVYHVLNRGNDRKTLFRRRSDYEAFVRVVNESLVPCPMRILQYCIMPNHWHFVLWPEEDGALAAFMHRLTTTHACRWNRAHDATGLGHVYQGPYKYFPVENDQHFYNVCRYVVRNALRANLVPRAELWPWCSLHPDGAIPLHEGPLPIGPLWLDWVNTPQSQAELDALRRSVARGIPYGTHAWTQQTATALGLEHTLGRRGRSRQSSDRVD